MVSKEQILSRMTDFIKSKVDELSMQSSAIMIFRPVIHRVSEKLVCKVDKVLSIIADDKGMIDIESILNEIGNNLITAAPKEYPDILNGLKIGGGRIVIDIPFIDKELVLTKEDFNELKSFILR
jgi:hypothetical protein